MRVPDTSSIRAFLDEEHIALAAEIREFSEKQLRDRSEPGDDAEDEPALQPEPEDGVAPPLERVVHKVKLRAQEHH